MAESFVDELVVVVRALVPKALERLEREGEQQENDLPRLYVQSDTEHMILGIARGRRYPYEPILTVDWYDLDDNGVAVNGALHSSGIPLSDSPPFNAAVTEDSVWHWRIASVVEEYRARQPEIFRRIIRTIQNGRKITEDEFEEPHNRWCEKKLGHLRS